MRAFSKYRKGVGVAVLALLAIVVAVCGVQFYIMEMGSTSMQPLISGQGDPPSHSGDFVVVARYFRTGSLRTGDLVVVDVPTPTGRVRTVRQIQQQPNTPAGQFYVRAIAEGGIDSRQFGPLLRHEIRGRVVWIHKRS